MRNQPSKSNRGFTLVEMIFTTAIVSILSAISLPALGGLVHGSQASSARNALATALNLARSSAVTRQNQVAICPSRDQVHCDNSIWWQHGWIVFQDLDHNGTRGDREPVLAAGQTQAGMAVASTTGRKHVTYRGDGSAPGTNVTFTFCDRRGATQAASLVINNAGRIRQGKPTPAQAAAACSGLQSD